MSRTTDAPRLWARLARLVAYGRPTRTRAAELRDLAERIAVRTRQPVRRVLARACRDAVARLAAEVAR